MVPPPFWHHLLADQVVQSGVSFGQSVLSISVRNISETPAGAILREACCLCGSDVVAPASERA